jgi:hypothetical protein
MPPTEPHVNIPLENWVEQIADRAATAAARLVIAEHSAACEIKGLVADLKADVYGNGKPGVKTDVHDLTVKMADLERRRNWRGVVAASLISSGVAGFVAWALWMYATHVPAARAAAP